MNNIKLSTRTSNLERLSTILNYQLSTLVLFLLSYFWTITLVLAVIAAIIFTFYMIFVLIEEKKYGWIIFFIFLVIVPFFTIILFLSDVIFYMAYLLIPLPLYYFYCFMLRLSVNDWIKERNWKLFNEAQKLQSKNNDDFITLK